VGVGEGRAALDWTAEGGCPYADTRTFGQNQKPRIISPGLLALRQWVLSNTARIYRVSPSVACVKLIFVSDCTEGGRLELQWLMEPLTGFADRVQYPLETPSRRSPRCTIYDLAGIHYVPRVTRPLVHFQSNVPNWHMTQSWLQEPP
jgi:hypothetical protein